MEEINKRNTESFRQALEASERRSEEQQKQINGLLAAVGTLSLRVNEVELKVNLQKAKLTGSGPSEKP